MVRIIPLRWVGFRNNPQYTAIRNAAAVYAQAKETKNAAAINAAKQALNMAINGYIGVAPAPPPRGPIGPMGPRRFGIGPRRPLNNSQQALKINGGMLQNGNTNSIYRFRGNYYGKAQNPDPQALVNGRRHGVYYRVNVAQNSPLTFKFSNANNLKGKEYILANGQFMPVPTAVEAENANLKIFRNWYATQAGLASNENRAQIFRTIRNRNLGNRPANGNAAQAQYNQNKKLQNVLKSMTGNRNQNNARVAFWAAVKKLNNNAAAAAAAAAEPTGLPNNSNTGGR